jgi:hypothetical protein
MISMRVARTLVDSVVQVGVAESLILRAAKLEPESRQALDSRLPRSKCYELIELALELTGDPAFGLHSVERLASDALNPISALVIHSATLQEAVRSILDFRRLLGDEASFRIYEDRGKVFIECDSLPSEVCPCGAS